MLLHIQNMNVVHCFLLHFHVIGHVYLYNTKPNTFSKLLRKFTGHKLQHLDGKLHPTIWAVMFDTRLPMFSKFVLYGCRDGTKFFYTLITCNLFSFVGHLLNLKELIGFKESFTVFNEKEVLDVFVVNLLRK